MTAHVHAKDMLLYAKDCGQSKRAWLKWEMLKDSCSRWEDLTGHPDWDDTAQYRRKPSTVKIGGVELADTRIRHLMELGTIYFVESITEKDYFEQLVFDGSLWDDRAVARGVAHSTSDGAAAFCRARYDLIGKPA